MSSKSSSSCSFSNRDAPFRYLDDERDSKSQCTSRHEGGGNTRGQMQCLSCREGGGSARQRRCLSPHEGGESTRGQRAGRLYLRVGVVASLVQPFALALSSTVPTASACISRKTAGRRHCLRQDGTAGAQQKGGALYTPAQGGPRRLRGRKAKGGALDTMQWKHTKAKAVP